MSNEQTYFDALRRIAKDYMTPEQMRCEAKRGRDCGIVFSSLADLLQAVAEYAFLLDGDQETFDHLISELGKTHTDSMGTSTIIY